jgi:hypothetical protein
MPDLEVERIARFLATHALLLLGVGMLAAVATGAAIVWAARLARRFRPKGVVVAQNLNRVPIHTLTGAPGA